jgi:acyl-CoA synthetase (NDP forming)
MNKQQLPLREDNVFWQALFAAKSIAVIGAKDTPGTWGADAMHAAVESKKTNPERRVYPVNPHCDKLMGLACHKTITDIPGPVELAVIVVPAPVAPQVFRQAAEKGIEAAVIVTAGFAEADAAGAALQEEIVATAAEYGLHFVGPNCVGHADFFTRVASAGLASRIPSGPVSLLSQSGTLSASIMQTVTGRKLGMAKLVSTGNEASIHLEDCLEFLGDDPKTEIIACYIEGLRQGRRFYEIAREITRKKPIVAIKAGGTGGAAQAAHSHTGALSGADAIYTAAFRQSGVIRAEDEEELADIAQGLCFQPLPKGNRVAILTMGGGFGVVTAEACEREGLVITHLQDKTIKTLDGLLPDRWNRGNPVDMVGLRPGAGDTTVPNCLHALLADNNVDAVISLLPPASGMFQQVMSLSPEKLKEVYEENERSVDKLAGELKISGKPVYLISRFSLLGEPIKTGYVPTHRIPEYTHNRRGATAIGRLVWYRHYLDKRKGRDNA